jgi:hypothetical protein
MQTCQTRGFSTVQSEGAGPACTVVVNQAADDPGGWTVDLFVTVPGAQPMPAFVRRFTLSAPAAGNPPTRIAGNATLAGFERWSAEVTPPTPAPNRPIQVGLIAGPLVGQGAVNIAP